MFDDDPSVARDRDRRGLVLAAAERGALDGRGLRIPRIDLDDPAEAVGSFGSSPRRSADTRCAACALRTFAEFHVRMPSRRNSPSSVYS
jgi:hypothetical protein